MSAYRDIIEKLRLKMPMVVTLPDPISGEPFSVNRDNILQLLVIDTSNLYFESATLAALFAEMSRIHRAAEKASEEEQISLRKWKAQMREECRRTSDKKPTDTQTSDYYQTHAEYETRYQKANDAKVLVGLAEDLKRAFELKSHAIHDIAGDIFGHNRVQNADERLSDMALENLAVRTLEESGSAAAAADFREGLANPPAPPPPTTDTKATSSKSEKKTAARKPRRTRKARSIKEGE